MNVLLIFVAANLFNPQLHPASFAAEESGQEQVEDREVNSDIAIYYEKLQARDFRDALAAAERLDVPPDNRAGKALVSVMRASALLGLKKDEEAKRLIAEAEKLAPRNLDVLNTLFLSSMVAGRYDFAGDAFDRLIAIAPDRVREFESDLVWEFLRNEPKDQHRRNDDRKVALAQLGFGGADGDYFTSDAVDILVKRGNVAAAVDLLAYIDEPQLVEDMLIQKRYSPLWPMLAESVGPNLDRVRKSSVMAAEQGYAESPGNHQKLHVLANALRHAGRHDEAIALRSKLPMTSDAMATVDEDIGWTVNNIALALHEVGRGDEADQLFALLNEAPIPEGKGRWRVSMLINRLELLVADGKFDRALPLLDATETAARNDGNAYAQQLVRRLRYCTLAGLGRTQDAATLLPDMMAHAKDAWHATVDGLICADEIDKAEQLVLEALNAEDSEHFQSQLVRSLQPKPLTSDDPSIWHGRWMALRGRPAIALEFEKLGRDMPEQFLPPPLD